MKNQTLFSYSVVFVVALAAGILLDRVVLTKQEHARPQPQAPTTKTEPVSEAAPTGSEVVSDALDAILNSPAPVAAQSSKSLDAILAERDPRQRMTELEAFINALSPGEYADALKRIGQITGNSERELASRLLVARWVHSDRDAALKFAENNRGFEYIADHVFEQLAAENVPSALERAKAVTNNDLRYMALRGVLGFVAATDPARALQLAENLGDFRGNEPLSAAIYRQWAKSDPQAALQAAQVGQGEGWRSPIHQVMRTWAGENPQAAANSALTLTDTDTRAGSLTQIMRQWARDDRSAAADWVNSLPPGNSHDAAVAGLAYSMVSADPGNAIAWIQTIADETARNNALQRVSREVMWRDPTNGASVLQAAGVPADLINQRRRPPRR